MIFGVVGNMGSGKTLSAVYIGYLYNKTFDDSSIITNFSTDYTDEIVSNPIDLEQASKDYSGLQLLDEVWAWADSRKSGDNEIFNDMIINSRKRGWIIIYTAQDFHMVDKRLRDNTDIAVIPEHHSKPSEDVLKIHFFDMPSMNHKNTVTVNPEKLYDMYDTTEEVGTDNKGKQYEDYIDEGIELLENGDVEYKNELISHLKLEKDLSNNDAEDITNMAFMRADLD